MNVNKLLFRSLSCLAALAAVIVYVPASRAQVMAPVVDASQSKALINTLNGSPFSSVRRTTATAGCENGGGCTNSDCGDSCTGTGPLQADCGPNCTYGFPLWQGACGGGDCNLGSGTSDLACVSPACQNMLGCSSGIGGLCGMGGCGSGCGSMLDDCCGDCGGCGNGKSRIDVYGEYLYLRSRNTEVAYAVPIDGPVAPVNGNGVQIGRTGVVDQDYDSGYRIGFKIYGGECNGLSAQWTNFQSNMRDAINIGAPDVIRSLVTHPLGTNAASDGLQATADYDIDFDTIDLAFRLPWRKCGGWCTEVIWGVRYGDLNQEFLSTIDVNGSTNVQTDVDFYGLGPQVGLAAQRRIGRMGVYAYSQGLASFLVGKAEATFQQSDTFAGTVAQTSWDSGRIVPQLDYELGIGFMTPSGRARLQAGYVVSAWFNAVRTDEYINAVQANNPDGLGDGLSFDGLVVRGEIRF